MIIIYWITVNYKLCELLANLLPKLLKKCIIKDVAKIHRHTWTPSIKHCKLQTWLILQILTFLEVNLLRALMASLLLILLNMSHPQSSNNSHGQNPGGGGGGSNNPGNSGPGKS